jgi:hypothetical protein
MLQRPISCHIKYLRSSRIYLCDGCFRRRLLVAQSHIDSMGQFQKGFPPVRILSSSSDFFDLLIASSQFSAPDEGGDVALSVDYGKNFDRARDGAVKDQVVPNRPEEDRAVLGQVLSPVTRARSLRQLQHGLVEFLDKAVGGLEIP